MLTSHPSVNLEYWFFKVNMGNTALLVDWIGRRRINEKILRVSIHSPSKREVLFETLPELPDANTYLRPNHTQGKIGDVEWDLTINLNEKRIAPDIFPAGLLRMADLQLVSAPLATFTGLIRHGNHQIRIQEARGLVSHYWGRQLAPEWWWVSTNQFEEEGYAVECTVLRSKLWGTSIEMPLAYLYLAQPHQQELIMAPLGLAQVSGSPEQFQIEIRRLGKASIFLTGRGRAYGDLGEGIMNTLVGDLEVRVGSKLLAQAKGTAGLEYRNRISKA